MAAEHERHKLEGCWRIYQAGNVTKYAWAAGLPVDARFEITSDHRFVPGTGCKHQFTQTKTLRRPGTRIKLLHEGDHDEVELDTGESLVLTLDDATVLYFKLYYEGEQKRVWIMGPAQPFPAGSPLGLSLEHGGPHGEPT